MRLSRASAISIPLDTAADVMIFPRSTTRSWVYRAPNFSRCSVHAQWVVASTPSRSPAAARKIDPVQTLVTQVADGYTPRSQLATGPAKSLELPPGTTTTSGEGTSANEADATSGQQPV